MHIKSAEECQFDLVSLGEVMLRFDPGDRRIRNARTFDVWEGGGEYNVARSLSKCFGMKTAVVTALVDNDIGWLVKDFIQQGGVVADYIKWVPFDGVGKEARNGFNFTEKGFGVRGALGVSDRGHTAASQMKPGETDWDDLFGKKGVRWFHTGGIYAALSETTSQVILEAVKAAHRYGTIVSYDLNYRPSLWKSVGGIEAAQKVNKAIAPYVDVMLGNEEDFTKCLGLTVEDLDEKISSIRTDSYSAMMKKAAQLYPNFKVIATTLRTVKSACVNDWKALCFRDGMVYYSREYKDLEIYDRVGGGDSFASGLIYGFLQNCDAQQAVSLGAAHGALAMTTPGDASMANRKEVEALAAGGSARVVR